MGDASSSSDEYLGQAAVLILENIERSHILLTKRAEHLSSHSGEVAFPGGMWEPEDSGLRETALRESYEEVGLDPGVVEILGELETSYTRQSTKVKPFIGALKSEVVLQPSPDELDSLFWFPLNILLQDQREVTDVFRLGDREYWAPVYMFEGYRVWGFTARVLVEYARVVHSADIQRQHEAPVVRHGAAKAE